MRNDMDRSRPRNDVIDSWRRPSPIDKRAQFHCVDNISRRDRSGDFALLPTSVVDQRDPFVPVEADNEQAEEHGISKGKLRRLEMENGRTLTEHESVVDFLSVLYVTYQAEDCVELTGRERIGGSELRIEKAENLKEKKYKIIRE